MSVMNRPNEGARRKSREAQGQDGPRAAAAAALSAAAAALSAAHKG